jgi:hypothetical protein
MVAEPGKTEIIYYLPDFLLLQLLQHAAKLDGSKPRSLLILSGII